MNFEKYKNTKVYPGHKEVLAYEDGLIQEMDRNNISDEEVAEALNTKIPALVKKWKRKQADIYNTEDKRLYGLFIKDAMKEVGAERFTEDFRTALFRKVWDMSFLAYGYEGILCTLRALVNMLEGFDVVEQKRRGCGYMTADDWMEIEEKSYSCEELTMEDIAAWGPRERKRYRESSSNPYFFPPDRSLYDETLYDGYKVRENAEVQLIKLKEKYEEEKRKWMESKERKE